MSDHRLLRASAGTGKTYQLTEAYARLITEGGMRPREVVAITFTRKAAAELKLRIRDRLRAHPGDEALLTELAHAPVTNFHGLALQLLRHMGSRAGVSPGTGILGDGEDARMFTAACESAWLTDVAEDAVGAAVARVSQHLDVAFALPDALWETLSRAREDGRPVDATLLGTYDAAAAQAAAHARLKAIAGELAAGLETLGGKSRDKLQAFVQAADGIGSAVPADAGAWSAAFKCLDRRGKLGQLYTTDMKDAVEESMRAPEAEAACGALAPALGTMLEAAWQRYEADKKVARVMDFGDIIARVVHALQSDAALHAEATANIRAVLVDEAQDTNPLQREMIRLLARLAGPAGAGTAAGATSAAAQLIVVGDRKQCIYTFRGADPRSFDLFAGDIAAMGGTQTQLRVSRRSRPHLVAGINHLGAQLFGAEAYEALEPLPRTDGPQGGMHWVPLLEDVGAGDGGADDASVDPAVLEARSIATLIREAIDAGAAPADFAVLLATMTRAPLLAETLAQVGVPAVVGGGGGLLAQPEIQDILAFAVWLTDPGARLEAAVALRSPLIGLSDGALTQLLQRPRKPAQDDATASGADAPADAGSTRGDPVTALMAGHVPSLDPAGITRDDEAALAMLAAWLPQARQAALNMSVADCLQFCDAQLHIRALARGLPGGVQKCANVERLFDLAARFDGGQAGGLPAFVRLQAQRLAQGYDEPLTPDQAAVQAGVRVCSVHQSKGLQFPKVVLAFLNRRGRNHAGCMRYDRTSGLVFAPRPPGAAAAHHTLRWRRCAETQTDIEDAELRRLLYVAVTRAEEEVWFVGPQEARGALAGFGRFLMPWRAAAEAAGLLQNRPLRRTWQQACAQAAAAHLGEAPAESPNVQWMPTTPPPGAALETTVTALAAFAMARAAEGGGQAARARAKRRPAAAAALKMKIPTQGETHALFEAEPEPETKTRVGNGLEASDQRAPVPALEPRLRGHLVHRVLSAVAHLPSHPDTADFVTAQLEIAGFAAGAAQTRGLHEDLVAFLEAPAARPMLSLPPERRRHELPFIMRIPHPRYKLTLRGQLDLVYEDNEGLVIVDYKHAREDPESREGYLFQLDAYAWAVAEMCNTRGPIRTRLVYLRDRRPPYEHLATDARRHAVADALRAWADNNA